MCPIVHFDRASGMPRERGFEVGRRPERAVDDLGGESRINAADRATPELGIEGRSRPRIVVRNPVKHTGRNVSGRGYHGGKLTRVAGTGTEIGRPHEPRDTLPAVRDDDNRGRSRGATS